jgi:hypothetical protein
LPKGLSKRLKLETLSQTANDGQRDLFTVNGIHYANNEKHQGANTDKPGNHQPKIEKIERQYHAENVNHDDQEKQDQALFDVVIDERIFLGVASQERHKKDNVSDYRHGGIAFFGHRF